MGKIYISQPVRIELSYLTLPDNIVSAEIRYHSSTGQSGSFSATIDHTDKLIYVWSDTGLEGSSGNYTFWSVVTDSNGEEYPGEPIELRIYDEGN